MEPLPERPGDIDTELLLELTYFLLSDAITDVQKARRDKRRRELETSIKLGVAVECSNCHELRVPRDVGDCPRGHRLCRTCVRQLVERESSSPEVACPGTSERPNCGSFLATAILRSLLSTEVRYITLSL